MLCPQHSNTQKYGRATQRGAPFKALAGGIHVWHRQTDVPKTARVTVSIVIPNKGVVTLSAPVVCQLQCAAPRKHPACLCAARRWCAAHPTLSQWCLGIAADGLWGGAVLGWLGSDLSLCACCCTHPLYWIFWDILWRFVSHKVEAKCHLWKVQLRRQQCATQQGWGSPSGSAVGMATG